MALNATINYNWMVWFYYSSLMMRNRFIRKSWRDNEMFLYFVNHFCLEKTVLWCVSQKLISSHCNITVVLHCYKHEKSSREGSLENFTKYPNIPSPVPCAHMLPGLRQVPVVAVMQCYILTTYICQLSQPQACEMVHLVQVARGWTCSGRWWWVHQW